MAGTSGRWCPFARAAGARATRSLVAGAAARRAAWWSGPGSRSTALGEPRDRAAEWAPVFNGNAPGAVHVVQELFVALDARAALPGMLALVQRRRPDLIVRETTEFASCVAAAHFDVPLVDVGLAPRRGDRHRRGAARDRRARAASSSARFRLDAPVLTCSRRPRRRPTPSRRFRHPARERIDESLIYVSFGSEIRSPELFREHRARARGRSQAAC